ncbi:MAG TPA: Uma2 family endonuclease [Verrucomicrobiales bacterium]|nr:Uma2 family endonuclease [Verrucomicrobiales bacterium]
MNPARNPPQREWTESGLQALPDDGFIHELVNGELIMRPKNNFFHGWICTRLSAVLTQFAAEHRLGVVLDSSTGFWMQNRNCRAPDLSFVSKAHLRELNFSLRSNTFFPGAPDLAVEILSPHNTRAEMDDRLRDFFASGARLVWVINPETESVEICRSLSARQLTASGGFLDGEDVLPGFRFAIVDLFREMDWE